MLASEGKLGPHQVLLPLLQLRSAPGLHNRFLARSPPPVAKSRIPWWDIWHNLGFHRPIPSRRSCRPSQCWPTDSQENCKTKAFTPDQIPPPWVFKLLVYTEENLFPALSKEEAGHRQLCH